MSEEAEEEVRPHARSAWHGIFLLCTALTAEWCLACHVCAQDSSQGSSQASVAPAASGYAYGSRRRSARKWQQRRKKRRRTTGSTRCAAPSASARDGARSLTVCSVRSCIGSAFLHRLACTVSADPARSFRRRVSASSGYAYGECATGAHRLARAFTHSGPSTLMHDRVCRSEGLTRGRPTRVCYGH